MNLVDFKYSNECLHTYIFFRDDMFYPVELKDDEDAIANAKLNSGTLKVEDLNGRVVWKAENVQNKGTH
jgi:hypothetical protein